jgi:hypothetical protein
LTLSPPREISRTAVNQLALPYIHPLPGIQTKRKYLPTKSFKIFRMPILRMSLHQTKMGRRRKSDRYLARSGTSADAAREDDRLVHDPVQQGHGEKQAGKKRAKRVNHGFLYEGN